MKTSTIILIVVGLVVVAVVVVLLVMRSGGAGVSGDAGGAQSNAFDAIIAGFENLDDITGAFAGAFRSSSSSSSDLLEGGVASGPKKNTLSGTIGDYIG